MTGSRVIKAIETKYAGCRFRSRLEARWAVFFDHLGIAWQYEPEGFVVGPEDRRRGYLPDFLLPGLDLWVEVKGRMDDASLRLITDAAILRGGLPGTNFAIERAEGRVLVLGDVPQVGTALVGHSLLCWYKGDVYREWVNFTRRDRARRGLAALPVVGGWEIVANDGGDIFPIEKWSLTTSLILPTFPQSPLVQGAYVAARSARFEHGESG